MKSGTPYRGRIAPSPTGYLHVGHAMTFWCAQERARAVDGKLILRIEDIDLARCRPEFRDAIEEDLRWFGIDWDEGPYVQSERVGLYRDVLARLRASGAVYACRCSRKDVMQSSLAPHDENEEPIYPGTCRDLSIGGEVGVNWRFRVPDGEQLEYVDGRLGKQVAVAGKDFGDFVVWRRDDVPAYQLAVVADDAAMGMTEVVRGEDLRTSTFRQLLLYRALRVEPPQFYHTELVTDASGKRLAKRDAGLTLRALREQGINPHEIRRKAIGSG